ncbi:hypothetical protein [Thermosipho globiformans]|uniref:hypothetical protein n=1 Tax=Thermosipho globiformans TaxID=380685 RepID=UPI000F8D4313|nr:hypothetical protein [Thermosipho globiformans]
MRIIKNIVETLKMELGFIKVNNLDLELSANASENSINLSTKTLDKTLRTNVLSLEFESKANVKNEVIEKNIIQIKDIAFSGKNLKLNELSFKNFTKVKNQTLIFNIPNCTKTPILIKNIKINKTGEFKVKINKNYISPIYTITFLPTPSVKKEKILKLLKNIIANYKNSDIKFVGYYKNIPIGYAYNIIITDRKLILHVKSKGKDISKDIVVFKIGEKYKLEVIED